MIKTTCSIALALVPFAPAIGANATSTPTLPSVATTFPSPSSLLAPDGKAKFENIEFMTRDKQTVHAEFYAPRKKGRAPAVLLVHDAGSSATSLHTLAEALQRKGFAVLIPNLRGHGASTTEKCDWTKAPNEEAKTLTWGFAMRDLEAASGFLREQKCVHNSNLSLVGVGAGSVLAARYAVRDENARAVAFIAPEVEVYGFNILKDINELGGLPVLLMSQKGGRQEANRIQAASTGANDGIEFVKIKSLKPKKAGDLFSDRRLASEVTKFLTEQTKPKR